MSIITNPKLKFQRLVQKTIIVTKKICAQVFVLIGDPIELDDLVKENSEKLTSPAEFYDAIARRVRQRMQLLKEELDQLVRVRELQLAAEEEKRHYSVERAQDLLQYIDWEAQGHLPESASNRKKRFLDLNSVRNSDEYAQISEVQGQSGGKIDRLPSFGYVVINLFFYTV